MAFAVTHDFTADTTAQAAQVNTNFADIETELNDFPTDGTLGTGVVDTAQLASDAVTTAKITNLNVTTAKLAADAVTAAKLADNAVVTANVDTSGAFAILGTRVTTDNASATIVKDKAYKANSDGEVTAFCPAANTQLLLYVHTTTTFTSSHVVTKAWGGTSYQGGCSCWVKKDSYFQITNSSGTPTITWMPIGTGTCTVQ